MAIQKTSNITISDRRKDGGRIVISTGAPDRQRDRVFPQGAKIENYMRNPVVQWGHNAYEPWATIGRTRSIEITETGIVADFELRPAANDQDPQNIVLLLWDQDFVRAASIGFRPEAAVPNEYDGYDFIAWELLEFSLVPIPANQDALRLAAKSYPQAFASYQKAGRALSARNERDLRAARDLISGVLEQVDEPMDAPMDDPDEEERSQRARRIAAGLRLDISDPSPKNEPNDTPSPELLAQLDRILIAARSR